MPYDYPGRWLSAFRPRFEELPFREDFNDVYSWDPETETFTLRRSVPVNLSGDIPEPLYSEYGNRIAAGPEDLAETAAAFDTVCQSDIPSGLIFHSAAMTFDARKFRIKQYPGALCRTTWDITRAPELAGGTLLDCNRVSGPFNRFVVNPPWEDRLFAPPDQPDPIFRRFARRRRFAKLDYHPCCGGPP